VGHAKIATLELIERAKIVAVIRLKDPTRLRGVVDALVEGGIKALEITMSVPGAVDLIRATAPTLPSDFRLGAGTVTNAETAHRVIDAGATFIVSPVFRREVIDVCRERDVAVMPGCFTPTEILDAWEAGADVIKVFPATALGPGYLRDVRAPLPQVKLMPTGGVTVENAGEWIKAGAVAVGVGTSLLDTKAIDAGDYRVIVNNARRMIANIEGATS
jgi:2-dehydro-3-deoxyphosphogluconate aldolase / (4S)-4-hydroxy-2-oxoglutarate aldolase